MKPLALICHAHSHMLKSVFCLVSVLLCRPPLWQSPVFASHLSSRCSLCVNGGWSAHKALLPFLILSPICMFHFSKYWKLSKRGRIECNLLFVMRLSHHPLSSELSCSSTTCQKCIHLCNKYKRLQFSTHVVVSGFVLVTPEMVPKSRLGKKSIYKWHILVF